MSISSFTTDYTGRLLDIFIFRGMDPESQTLQTATLEFGAVSSYCAGIEKLVQRYAIALLTQLGSQSDFSSFGSDLLNNLNSSANASTLQVRHMFAFANFAVIQQFRTFQQANSNYPLDEQLATATLNDISLIGSSVSFNITVTSLSGETVSFLLPIPV